MLEDIDSYLARGKKKTIFLYSTGWASSNSLSLFLGERVVNSKWGMTHGQEPALFCTHKG